MTEPSEHEPDCPGPGGCDCALAERQEIHRLRDEVATLKDKLHSAIDGQQYWRGRFIELNGEAED